MTYGPLERAEKERVGGVQQDSEITFQAMEGTYAIWVGGEEPGASYHLALSDPDTQIDPQTRVVEPPEEPDLRGRDLALYYPWHPRFEHAEARRLAWARYLYAEVPERLFVYARAELRGDDAGDEPAIGRGEPLLITEWLGDKVAVVRADGRTRYVAMSFLGVTRDGDGFPVGPYVPKPNEAVSQAIDDAGDDDASELSKQRERVAKFEECVGAYLEKHDPTWGSGATVFRVRGGHVENVGAAVAKRAEASCGLARLESEEARLLRQLNTTRAARWAAVYAAGRSRFLR